MRGSMPQLPHRCDVLTLMNSVSKQRTASWESTRKPQMVAIPQPHEGVRRALLGSFGSIPAMPEAFVRLLDKID